MSPRRAVLLLLAVVVAYGALLRFDAVTLLRGPLERPSWLRSVQQSRSQDSLFRPAGMYWSRVEGRYTSDPYTYLQYAREMRSFYAAHRREPAYPFATRVWLWLLGNQDQAVSFASATFGVLLIVATFLLGREAFNQWVGLGAALAVAVEFEVVTFAAGGWRDDAFACAVALSAYAMLRYQRGPTPGRALALGAAGGVACLIRITSLSFLVPGFLLLAFTTPHPWRERLRGLAAAAALAAALVGPYMFNCWRVFDDPLYAINVHADIYRAAEGQEVEGGPSQTASEYLRDTARARPMQTLDTALLGMTSYPFANKWTGFQVWVPGLGRWLSWAALAGLFLFLGSPGGRLLLVVLAASLVPYALTWRLIHDWRFTLHAYPFFMVAAAFAAWRIPALLLSSGWRRRRPGARTIALWAGAVAVVATGTWLALRVLPVAVAKEALAAGESVNFGGGGRDGAFFGEGWTAAVTTGNVTARISDATSATMSVPLPRAQDYGATVRMDPFPPPAAPSSPMPAVRVFANGQLVATIQLTWNPERVGAYTLRLPARVVRAGRNRLMFAATTPAGAPAAIRLWYVRVHPNP